MVEETYNEAMRLYEYYERMNDEIAKQEAEEAAKAREAEGLPVVMDAELVGEPQEVRHVEVGSVAGGFLLVRWRVSGVYTTLGVFVDTTAAGWLLLLMVLGASRRFYHAIDLNHHWPFRCAYVCHECMYGFSCGPCSPRRRPILTFVLSLPLRLL